MVNLPSSITTPLHFAFWERLLGFARFVGRRLVRDRCLQTAGSLTYTTLLAFVPLFTIALTLFSAFPVFNQYSGRFKTFLLTNLVPDASGKLIGVYMRQFSDNAERLTAMGMVGLVLTALLLVFTIEKSFNEIWAVRRPRKLLARTLIYWASLTLAPLLIGISLSLASALDKHAGDVAWLNLAQVTPLILGWLTLTLIYVTVPNCYVPRTHAMIAALVSGVLLELMKQLFSLYLRQFGTFKLVYGAFASIPIFLMWLYVCWVIILGGAVLTASLSYWHRDGWRWGQDHGSRFEQAIHILATLAAAHQQGVVLHLDELRRRVQLGIDATHGLLELMAVRNWVEEGKNGEWLLAVSPAHIQLMDVYQLVGSSLSSSSEPVIARILQQSAAPLQISLQRYLDQRPELFSTRETDPAPAEGADRTGR
ncbi:YihY family inner membrane protein [Chitinilyticum litopenaei]|uniref:YihY family inner membrane protein n=1 Tax=Chitinilyticum litopenaei TaxID=1121276 RepID=UPI000408A15C|nr:YihY family inner membrane protein [Chitinilyticum litopenaei]